MGAKSRVGRTLLYLPGGGPGRSVGGTLGKGKRRGCFGSQEREDGGWDQGPSGEGVRYGQILGAFESRADRRPRGSFWREQLGGWCDHVSAWRTEGGEDSNIRSGIY